MLRAPLAAAFLVLSALTLAGVAARPIQAALAEQVMYAEEASSGGCPYAGPEGRAAQLPPGHPPLSGDDLGLPPGHPALGPGRALPPGHPPVGQGLPAVPRFDRQTVVDL